MDPRLASLLARLQATRFAELTGSESYTVLRIGDPLLNEAAAAFLASSTVVRTATIRPRASNQIELQVKLAKPAFLPPFTVTLQVDQQPRLPEHPELVLRMMGAGGLLRLAGPAIESSGALPPGVRIEADRVVIDLRRLLQQHGHGELLDFADQVHVLTEDNRLVIAVQLKIR